MDRYFAHSTDSQGQPTQRLQPLQEHLKCVAELARHFAEPFGGGEWAFWAGLWHDLGKYSEEFQRYLLQDSSEDFHEAEIREKVDHTSAGAQYATEKIPCLGYLLAYAVSGHHAGLLDGVSANACLYKRLTKKLPPWEHGLGQLPPFKDLELPMFLKEAFEGKRNEAAFRFSFFIRMIFSCLVDADFLDTACFLNPDIESERPIWPGDILKQIDDCLEEYVRKKFGCDDSTVNKTRFEVRQACLAAAEKSPGLFSLTVPTGGGKTLSSLAFALKHAKKYGLQRIIYVLPFTSIIEQNARVFREVTASLKDKGLEDPVVEHHSTVNPEKETLAGRLASENWDAPIVVTTTVQFYESLFSNRPSRCRKLHNLARSVIILDEVQKLPVDYLRPCLAVLKELASPMYGSTVVLCTATQPAVHQREEFPIGLAGVREIVPEPKRLYEVLKRVTVEDLGRLSDDDLSEKIGNYHHVLCIVNTRRHAQNLFLRCRDREGVYHLSAGMCPAHRAEVLGRIKKALDRGEPCRLISTQVVEAGIDLDFPVVFRSLAGLDSVAQAAGRCNRNGRFPKGNTFLFRSEHQESETFLRDTINATSQILGGEGRASLYEDLLSLEAVEHYFRLYYWSQKERWDRYQILDELQIPNNKEMPFMFGFKNLSQRFRMIKEVGEAVFVPWGEEGKEYLARLRFFKDYLPCSLMRSLQRFVVQVPKRFFMESRGLFQQAGNSINYLPCLEPYYDPEVGFCFDKATWDPESLLI